MRVRLRTHPRTRQVAPSCESLKNLMPMMKELIRKTHTDYQEHGLVGYFDRKGRLKVLEVCKGDECQILPKTYLPFLTEKGEFQEGAPLLVGNFFFHTHPSSDSVPSVSDARTIKEVGLAGWCIGGFDFNTKKAAKRYTEFGGLTSPVMESKDVTPVIRCRVSGKSCPVRRGKWALGKRDLRRWYYHRPLISGEEAERIDRDTTRLRMGV